ncbi:MAG: hypothetical protein ACYCQJ_08840 [Nitrososphaerales archaeon]
MARIFRYPWNYVIPIAVLILIIAGLAFYNNYYIPAQEAASSHDTGLEQIQIPALTPSNLTNIPHYCDTTGCNYHWHVHLDIYVNSSSYVVIPNELGHIGNQQYDLYAIHTHDYSGIIHIECCDPNQQTIFTLGNLFEVWGYPVFDSRDCLIYHGLPVAVYVNGVEAQSPLANVQLTNHVEIAITIGYSHPAIPSSYTFPPGF